MGSLEVVASRDPSGVGVGVGIVVSLGCGGVCAGGSDSEVLSDA